MEYDVSCGIIRQFTDLHFFRVSYQSFIHFLVSCHVFLISMTPDLLYEYVHI